MKAKKSIVLLPVGAIFTIFGLGLTAAGLAGFLAKTHPHGLMNAYQFITVGPLLLFIGLMFCFDKGRKH
jgi:hypothetical protein